jgi:hypothetical protein
MTDNNTTEWIATKEVVELTGYHGLCSADVPVAVLDKGDEEDCQKRIVGGHE